MTRRSVGLAALYASALFVGAVAGGAMSVPSVYAQAAAMPPQANSRSPQGAAIPNYAPAKKAPPVTCKTTKECPQDHICSTVSDHKECTPTKIMPPKAPVVT